MRIGQGLDVHAFSDDPSRPLILGGVVIPGERGLAGHSDADAATHALMDALLAVELPVIEVHVTNIHRREEFRHHSYVSKAATGVIAGLGVGGYRLALIAMADLLEDQA